MRDIQPKPAHRITDPGYVLEADEVGWCYRCGIVVKKGSAWSLRWILTKSELICEQGCSEGLEESIQRLKMKA